MSDKTQHFAVSDVEYDIITTMSNLLQGEEVLKRYEADAEKAGNTQVAQIFRQLKDQNNQIAGRLREALRSEFNTES